MKSVDCFITYSPDEKMDMLFDQLKEQPHINNIFLLGEASGVGGEGMYEVIQYNGHFSTDTVQKIASSTIADYTLLITKETNIQFGQFAIDRYLSVAEDTGAGLIYSNYYEIIEGKKTSHPVIDYQKGSLRDDFNFGPVLFFNSRILKEVSSEIQEKFKFAGLYQLRLAISRRYELFHLQEVLYSSIAYDTRVFGKKNFDYVDPKNRSVQIEMENAVTTHLREVGAYLEPTFANAEFDNVPFETEASVIIPVLNREKTIADAIESVMLQHTNFSFNLIIVDNHSTDSTTEIIQSFVEKHDNIIHIIPDRGDLGIGGCWNLAVHNDRCGKFAVQLDSDDLYKVDSSLQQIIDLFYRERCAMVIGSYQMTDFELEEIPPGIIDHKEWTPDNGRNNALRINGLGAPRAFYTPVLREIKIPNVNYGEDYGLGLAISRHYQIGRIYKPIYICRRWEDNSDASLNIEAMNRHNHYKDRLRTIELKARIRLNNSKQGKNPKV